MVGYGADQRGSGCHRAWEKQLNYVWSVSELDKKKKLRSKKIAGIRGWIQAAATLLTNPHIPNFFQGQNISGQGENGMRTGTKLLFLSCCDGSVPHRSLSGGCRIIQI